MNWRPIGSDGPYPAWMAELANSSGVYAIRERGLFGGGRVVYVGESHTGNLRKTIQRHFQAWRRAKKWWTGAYRPAQTDPGHTYHRSGCEVAFETCSKDRALELQSKWIARLKPRDNLAGVVEDVPF